MVGRKLARTLASLLLIGASASPIASNARAAAPADPITLKFAIEFSDTPTIAAITRDVIDPFEKAYPGIKIQLQPYNGAAALDQQLKVTLAAGAGPDIYDENSPTYMPPLIDAGGAANLDSYAQHYGWKAKIVPFAYQASLYKGHLYSLPTETETLHLWYNADLMTKHGWDPPRTFTEMVGLGNAIRSQGLQVFGNGFADCKPCWEWWAGYVFSFSEPLKKQYGILTGRIPWTDPALKQGLTKLKQLWDLGFMMDKQATALSFNDGWGAWGRQQAVLRMEGDWGFIPGLAPTYGKSFHWNIAPLPLWDPALTRVTPIGIGECEGLNPKSAHLAQAALFLNWFVHDRGYAASWAASLGSVWIPPLHYRAGDIPANTDPRFKQVLIANTAAMNSGTAAYLPWSFWPAKTEAYAWGNMESMLLGQISVDRYLEGLNAAFRADKTAGDLPTVPKPAGM
jgi:raffinose/stachyose/melibiose transport system substrate-binding protein